MNPSDKLRVIRDELMIYYTSRFDSLESICKEADSFVKAHYNIRLRVQEINVDPFFTRVQLLQFLFLSFITVQGGIYAIST